MFEFVENAGLHLISLGGPYQKFKLSVDYPANFDQLDEKTRRHLKRMSDDEKAAIAELVDGSLDNLYAYVSKQKDAEASFSDKTMIPYVYGEPKNFEIILESGLHEYKTRPRQRKKLLFQYQITPPKGAWPLSVHITPTVSKMVDLMKDGNKTIQEIVTTISAETAEDENLVFQECKKFYQDLKMTDIINLRGKDVPPFKTMYKRPIFALTVTQ